MAFQAGTYPVNTAIAQYYGATTLTPEKSTNYGLGVIIEPGKAPFSRFTKKYQAIAHISRFREAANIVTRYGCNSPVGSSCS